MKISVSNIAWDSIFDESVSSMLFQEQIKYIDLAPTKYVENINELDRTLCKKITDFWLEKNISFLGMQSLFYGKNELNIFDEDNFKNVMSHCEKLISIASMFKIKVLIFGSPLNRFIKNKNKNNNLIAKNFFNEFSKQIEQTDITLCIEPNPKEYGCNFLTNTIECIDFVKELNLPNVKTNLDLSAVQINNKNLLDVVKYGEKYFGYVHISDPYLTPLENIIFHENSAKVIKSKLNPEIISLEVNQSQVTDIKELQNSIKLVKELYSHE